MNTARHQFRSGFLGIDILVMLIIIAIISAIVGHCSHPTTAPSSQPSKASSQAPGTAKAVAETARATTAVAHMAQGQEADQSAVDSDPPTAAASGSDATDADPAAGDGLGDILDSIFDGF
jgi:predicted lipid-binding transport protein (Tim44 family)